VTSKLRLFQNQTLADCALIRREDQARFFPQFQFPSKVFYFSEGEGENSNEKLLYSVTKLKGLDPARTKEVLSKFRGLEHRLESVAEIDGIQFVNDSKCTSLEALTWGLEKYPDKKVILLAGGHPKGADFRTVRSCLAQKLKRGVVYGEAQELLWESWQGAAPLVRARDLAEAFKEALKGARAGDVVLLSPACASFDQFPNYKERGKLFKKLVQEVGAPLV
jgi:UDP-N-acetylmuramoylalanine--D-glutamate ligase